jgi:hypothetical protein
VQRADDLRGQVVGGGDAPAAVVAQVDDQFGGAIGLDGIQPRRQRRLGLDDEILQRDIADLAPLSCEHLRGGHRRERVTAARHEGLQPVAVSRPR